MMMTKPKLGSSNVGLLIATLRFASLVHRPMRDGVAEPEGLSANELRIVIALGGEGLRAGYELSELIGMPAMNVSRALAALATRGWVEQVADPGNRRRKPYQLSKKGWTAYKAMGPEIDSVASFLFSDFDKAERTAMASGLDKLYARVMSWESATTPPSKQGKSQKKQK
jgi:DNA-binding MarR family transcriptional regulator